MKLIAEVILIGKIENSLWKSIEKISEMNSTSQNKMEHMMEHMSNTTRSESTHHQNLENLNDPNQDSEPSDSG